MDIGPVATSVLLGVLRSGEPVYDSNPSHLEGHPTVHGYLNEALGRIASGARERIVDEVDFGRFIGTSNCVPTYPGDDIVFAQRKNREGLSRFVKNRSPVPCSSVVVIIARATDGRYVLRTAYIGNFAPAEPWDSNAASPDSLPFWNAHALAWGHAEIVPGSETPVCPWDTCTP